MFTFNYKRFFGTWLAHSGSVSADSVSDASAKILSKFGVQDTHPNDWTERTEADITLYILERGDGRIEFYQEPSLFQLTLFD